MLMVMMVEVVIMVTMLMMVVLVVMLLLKWKPTNDSEAGCFGREPSLCTGPNTAHTDLNAVITEPNHPVLGAVPA